MSEAFSYTVLQVVPAIERNERFNAGVVLHCRRARFLKAEIDLDATKWKILGGGDDVEDVRRHLEVLRDVAAGTGDHPVARLDQSERFHWLAAPSSTVVQPTPVHTGLTDDPQATLQRLFRSLVV